jgi:hypothetical protein
MGDLGSAFEATSIDGCLLFCRSAEIYFRGILGLMQHQPGTSGPCPVAGRCRLDAVELVGWLTPLNGLHMAVAIEKARHCLPGLRDY